MRLSDRDIRDELADGDLSIDPIEDEQIGPSSIDLRFSGSYKYPPNEETIDVRDYESDQMNGHTDELRLSPHGERGSLVLCTTKEDVFIPKYMDGNIWGRSSIGRLFSHIHTAGYVDSGYGGDIVLEMVNHSNNEIVIPKGMRVCQMTLTYLNRACEIGYNERDSSKYANQRGVVGSRISKDF